MSPTIERECAEHIHWHPYVTIERYSVEQSQWAEAKLAAERSWGRLPVLRNIRLGEFKERTTRVREQGMGVVHRIHGNWLRELFPNGPEDGYAYDDGNLLVNEGLTNIINLLNGTAQSNTVRTLINTQTVVGVGNVNTAATTGDIALGANGSSAYYQQSDATFPSITGPATINNQCTFASGNANFAWNEWCWAVGTGTITAGATLGTAGNSNGVFGTSMAALINHKVPASSLGTKASGASWVFSTTIVFS